MERFFFFFLIFVRGRLVLRRTFSLIVQGSREVEKGMARKRSHNKLAIKWVSTSQEKKVG